MAAGVRERLAALAAPLGITLPEAYIAFVESPPESGILIHHLRDEDDPEEWWPETIKGLEANIYRGERGRRVPYAHYMRQTAENYLASGPDATLPGPGRKKFRASRMARGFWIGEEDGDSVFLDQETLGVFAFLQHDDRIEQWATSFAEFVAHCQQ
jgi:hypothetical protein